MKQSELKRRTPLRVVTPRPRSRAISPASKAQRDKVGPSRCVVCAADRFDAKLDPAHLCARGQGGCDHPACVVCLCRTHHSLFDAGGFDLLPHLVGRHTVELQHALGHYDGDLIGLLHRLTGERWRTA